MRPGFSPGSLPGLQLWLRADTGVFQDPGLGTPALAAGDPVGGWRDQSGRGHHALQAAAASRPTLAPDAAGGRPALRFDGVDDWMRAACARAARETVFFVGRFAGDGNRTMLDAGGGNARRVFSEGPASSAPPPSCYAGGAMITAPAPGVPLGSWFLGVVQFNGAQSFLKVDGVTCPGTLAPSGDDLVLGLYGETAYMASPLQGGIAEVLIYDGALAADQVRQVESYLKGRYALP